ncbi:MAG: riboflavin synthase [Propionibacteriales bacterium]|nr:riboflavin synthase [Propionibacteriales bacterium]
MFTGIVEELGVVTAIEPVGGPDSDSVRLTVRGPRVVADARPGDSIAVNGCCLTVTHHDAQTFSADVMAETLDKTSIGRLAPGSPVNLERAMAADGRLGGHIVQGHVDGTGTILERIPGEHWEVVRIGLPRALARYVAVKGSITVDGVSLTVVSVDDGVEGGDGAFTVSLIPTTLAETTLGEARVGSPVNLEVDVIAKYVERLQAAGDDR